MRSHIHAKLRRVSRLHEHRARPRELTNETFPGAHVANDTTTRHPFQDVVAIPRDKVSVIDNVLFAFAKLEGCNVSQRSHQSRKQTAELTSFRMMAPILWIQQIPMPAILYTNRPSPEKMAWLNFWLT
jgi:hypothetical protein